MVQSHRIWKGLFPHSRYSVMMLGRQLLQKFHSLPVRQCAADRRQQARQVVQLISIMSNFKQKLELPEDILQFPHSAYSSCITIVNGRCSPEGGQRATLSSLWVVSWWRSLCGRWTVLCRRAGDIQSDGLTSSKRKPNTAHKAVRGCPNKVSSEPHGDQQFVSPLNGKRPSRPRPWTSVPGELLSVVDPDCRPPVEWVRR